MANGIGASLEISDAVFDRLEQADKAIEKLGTSSTSTASIVNGSFDKMANGSINDFIKKLKEADGLLSNLDLGNVNTGGIDNIVSSMSNVNNSTEKAATSIVDMYNVITDKSIKAQRSIASINAEIAKLSARKEGEFKTPFGNISDLKSQIDSINKRLTDIDDPLSSIWQQNLVNSRNTYQEELKMQQQNIDAKIANLEKQRTRQIEIIADIQDKEEKAAEKARIAQEKADEAQSKADKKRAEDVIKDLQKQTEAQRKYVEDRKRMYDSMFKQIEAQEKAAEKVRISTPTGALGLPENTINERLLKIKQLKIAQANLNKESADFVNTNNKLNASIRSLNSENARQIAGSKELRLSHNKLMDTAGQLARRMALIFSISQIQGYIMNMVRVRGEFELQNKALAAILQNKDEADRLFAKITDLAVKSPFQVKELVTYTKELAAYRIETEKLFDTTKMLADVSAGLGVDMSRLILAYGQVKAANYLRGTELRQFSEAGINILGELANEFTKVEGKVVSVGDVFERVSKRMVKFSDVEKVFKRITSEGGIFYNMQEIQAESLAGQMSNLRDSIDIMMNDIGKANDTTIKDNVALVRSMVENWREVVASIKATLAVMSPFIAYMVLAKINSSKLGIALLDMANNSGKFNRFIDITNTKLVKFLGGGKTATKAVGMLGTALGGLATLGVTAALAAITYGLTELYVSATKASRQASELKEKLDEILYESGYDANKLASNFESLANKILDSTTSAEDQKKALEELQNKYSEILPAQTLTIEGLKALKGSYDDVTKAIYSKIEAQAQEKAVQAAADVYGRDVLGNISDLRKELEKKGISTADATGAINRFKDAWEKGLIDTKKSISVQFAEIVKEISGKTIEMYDVVQDMSSAAGSGGYYVVENKNVTKLINSVKRLEEETKRARDITIGTQTTYDYRNIRAEYAKQEAIIKEEQKKIAEAMAGKDEFIIQQEQIRAYMRLTNEWMDSYKGEKTQTVLNFFEELREAQEKAIGSKETQGINKYKEEIKKLTNVDWGKLAFTIKTDDTSYKDYLDKLKGWLDEFNDYAKLSVAQLNLLPKFQLDFVVSSMGGKNVEDALNNYKAVKDLYGKLFKDISKPKTSSTKDTLKDLINGQIDAIKKANDAYNKFKETMSDTRAIKETKRVMKDEFQDVKLDIGKFSMFDEKGTIESLERLVTKFPKYKKIINKALSPLQIDAEVKLRMTEVENLQSEVDKALESHKITLEFEAQGFTEDQMKELFNFDAISFDSLNKMMESLKPRMESLGEEGMKIQKKFNADSSKLYADKLENDAKELSKYLIKTRTEREQVEYETIKQLNKINELQTAGKLTESGAKTARENVKKEEQQKIAKIDYEALKQTEVYQRMFEDLGNIGESTLNMLLSELEEFRIKSGKALDITELKELTNSIIKIREEVEARNPFKALTDGMQEFIDSSNELTSAKDRVALITEEIRQIEAEMSGDDGSKQTSVDLENKLVDAKERHAKAVKDVTDAEDKQRTSAKKMTKSVEDVKSAFTNMGNAINDAISLVKEVAESFGASFSPETEAVISSIGKAISIVAGALGIVLTVIIAITVAGTAMMAVLWPLLAIAVALAAVFAVFAVHDAKKEKAIKKEKENVEKLEKSYKKLEKAIAGAYSLDTLEESNELAQKNIDEQIASYQRMIQAENEKKKTDKDKIKEYQEAIDGLIDKKEELNNQKIADLGGFGTSDNIKSAAQDFANAWYDAFKETGDGLSGLQDQMNKFIENAVKKQLLLKLSKQYVKPILDSFDKMFDQTSAGGGMMTAEELEAWKRLYETNSKLFDDKAKAYLEALGMTEIGGQGELSELSKGIQSVTEDTAQALEALLNSIRFVSFDNNTQLKNIYFVLSSTDGLVNPILGELKLQTALLSSMNNFWSAIGVAPHNSGGRGLKVVL